MKARDVFGVVFGHSATRGDGVALSSGRSVKATFALACLGALALVAYLAGGASPAGADGACPNEAIRATQHATHLGDCRAWERVSPDQKGYGDLVGEGESVTAAASGNGAAFDSRLGFADTVGSSALARTTYLARRGAGGWSTKSITPQGRPEALQILTAPTAVELFSEELDTAILWGYDLPAAADDTPLRKNIYSEDTASGALRTITVSQLGGGLDPLKYFLGEFLDKALFGLSADAKHLTLVSNTQFLPAGTAPGYPSGVEFEPVNFPRYFTAPNVYTWNDGVLHLAGILPDGTVPDEGSTARPGGYDSAGFRGTISADGSRQTFFASPQAGAPPQLYLRIDNSRTVLISESENPALAEEPQNVNFEGMTPDGRNLFFTTESPLLAADTASGPDLYRWTDGPDPENEPGNLTLITDDGGAVSDPTGFGNSLVGMSDDASRVYVHSNGSKLLLWEEGAGIRTIDPFVPRSPSPRFHLALSAAQPGFGRVSPDGNWLAYLFHDESGQFPDRMYLYDRERDVRTCVSCPSTASLVPALTRAGRKDNIGFRPRFLSNGGRVFFTSPGALVPEDTNGVADVYAYDGPTGKLSLLTSGAGKEPSEFADASASGNDVFFLTRQRLVPTDTDDFIDLYDARVGGGFDEPVPVPSDPCAGEACQGAPSAGPPAAAPIASGAETRGNSKQRRGKKRRHRPRCTAAKRRAGRCGRPSQKHQKPGAPSTRAGRGGGR